MQVTITHKAREITPAQASAYARFIRGSRVPLVHADAARTTEEAA